METLELQPTLQKEALPEDGRQRILFVCSGNTCRSPMCEAVVNGLPRWNRNYLASSAGICAFPGDPISKNACLALQAAGIPEQPGNAYTRHTAQPVSEEAVAASDRVVCMTMRHLLAMTAAYPHYATRFCCFPGGGLSDPFGGDVAVYRDCLAEIIQGLEQLLEGEDA